jgi:transcriptional regulator with XRE-family HTH domain
MTTAQVQTMLEPLDATRRRLGMTYAVLARRSGVSQATVVRILSGRHPTASLGSVLSIADALGVDVKFQAKRKKVEGVRTRQAKQKAAHLVGMLQGTSALEAQALDADTLEQMKDQTFHELLAGSKRRLWGD